MDSIADFVSKDDQIIELTKKNLLLMKNNSKWKRKYEELKSPRPTIRKSRVSKAEVFVKAWIDGDKSLRFKDIADKCFLSIETIKNISYKLRHNI